MKMKYLDGKEANDDLFDRSLPQQRAYVARAMNLNPSEDGWPVDILDRLLAVRRANGREAFYREIGRMLSPDVH